MIPLWRHNHRRRSERPAEALSRDPMGNCLFCGGRPEASARATWSSPPMTCGLHPKLQPAGNTAGGDDHGVGCCNGCASDRPMLGRVPVVAKVGSPLTDTRDDQGGTEDGNSADTEDLTLTG